MSERPVSRASRDHEALPGHRRQRRRDFDLRQGEVHALLGENGAGKSTLMNIVYGLYTPGRGRDRDQRQAGRASARRGEAIERGIGMVHQHFMLIPVMTVAENIVLATEPVQGRRPARLRGGREARARDLDAGSGSPSTRARWSQDITVGQQQRVEILKALYRGADILVLDEPTAVLTPQEAQELFAILRSLHRAGQVDHLHQPQAERGARDRRPRSPCCAAARRSRRCRRPARPSRASRG